MKFKLKKEGLLFAIIILMFSTLAFSQIKISGVILDKKSELPVQNVSVLIESKLLAISNENGGFEISLSSLPTVITFKHVAYNGIQQEFTSADEQKRVLLVSGSISLPELVNKFSAEKIVNNVIRKSLTDTFSREIFYGHYKDISKENGKIGKFHEMFLNFSWGQLGVDKWEPVQVRHGQVSNTIFVSPNTRSLAFIRSSVLNRKNNLPLNVDFLNQDIYELKVKNYLNMGKENELVIISCKPKLIQKEDGVGHFSGDIYIDQINDNIKRINGTISNKKDVRGFVRSINIDVYFIINSRGFSEFSHLELIESVNSSKFRDKKISHVSLIVLEKEGKFRTNKVLSFFSKDDMIALKNETYNPKFWEENTPKQLTKLEKDAVKFFEKEKLIKGN
jgi:hypothetical protein